MQKKDYFKNFALLSVVSLSVSGCDSIKRTFGFDHYQADEMNVADNPPLSLPPCYDLRPPEKNVPAVATSSTSHTQKALEVISGKKQTTNHDTSKSQSTEALLKKVSATNTSDQQIKEKIESDAEKAKEKSINPLSGIGQKIMDNVTNVSNDTKEKK